MKTVLITGADGQLGSELMRASWPSHIRPAGYNRAALDTTDREAVRRAVMAAAPSVVVNAAAYTAVDRAEEEPDAAFAVNAAAVGYVAAASTEADAMLIHISTDYVFDGTKTDRYVEADLVSPLGVYGHSKAAGERRAATHHRHVILRTSWVYGASGTNFVRTMLRLAQTRDQLRVVADQVGCPTSAADLATAIVRIATNVDTDTELRGLYHLASPQEASWYELATAVLAPQLAESQLEIAPITTSEYPTPAPRPSNSRLDSTALEQATGIKLPDWSESLPGVVHELTTHLPRSPE